MVKKHKVNKRSVERGASSFDGGGGRNFMKLSEGKNVIRILPPWSEAGEIFQQVGFHAPPKKFADKIICTNFTFEGKEGDYPDCPICAKGLAVFKKHGKDAAKKYWPQKRAYMNVLDMKAKDGVVKIMEAGSTIMTPILNYLSELEDDDWDALLDYEVGQNILIKRYKESNFTKYNVMVMPKPYNLAKNGFDIDDIAENLHDLSALVKVPDQEEVLDLLAELNEYEDNDEDDEVVEEKPKTRKAVPAKKKAVVEEDDELDDLELDEEEEEEEDEDKEDKYKVLVEEEEEEPKAKTKTKAKAKSKAKKATKEEEEKPKTKLRKKPVEEEDSLDVDDVSDIDDDDLADLEDIPF